MRVPLLESLLFVSFRGPRLFASLALLWRRWGGWTCWSLAENALTKFAFQGLNLLGVFVITTATFNSDKPYDPLL